MPLHAGISLPQDEVGNCRQFAHLLKAQAQRHGARFLFQHEVLSLTPAPRPQLRRRAAWPRAERATETRFDAVRASAPATRRNGCCEPLGLSLPLAPVYGYSVTAPLQPARRPSATPGPRAAVMDEKYKVAISRLGQRVRVAGSAELGGAPGRMNAAALATLYKVLDDWFPGAARLSQASAWKGARPMLPDGPPVLGASRSPASG